MAEPPSPLKEEVANELGAFSSGGASTEAAGGTRRSCWLRFVSWIKALPLRPLMLAIRVLNVLLAVLLMLVYPLAFIMDWEQIKTDGGVFTNVMLMIYCTGFSIMLIVFEARVAQMDKRMNHLFGFMFSFLGRALFMCFLGTLAFAGTWVANLAVGSIAIVFAIVQFIIMYNHPAFQTDGEMSNRSSRLQGSYSSVDQAREAEGHQRDEADGPVIIMTERVELGRDDFEGEVDDDPFHVGQGVNHYDDDVAARQQQPRSPGRGKGNTSGAAVAIERPSARAPAASSSAPKAVSIAVVQSPRPAAAAAAGAVAGAMSSSSSSDEGSAAGVEDSAIDLDAVSSDDSDMENPFAQ